MGLNTQQDPIGITGGLNLYGYAGGDPINFSDPFGLCREEDETCLEMVTLLRGLEGETFGAAADRLDKYQGEVILSDFYPFSAVTNENRMILYMGSSMEGTPDGDRMITPGQGDLAVLLVHETAHLTEQGTFPGLRHPTGDAEIAALELRALLQLGTQLPAPIYRNRQRMGGR